MTGEALTLSAPVLFSCESATGRATLELFNHETFDHQLNPQYLKPLQEVAW